MKVTADDLLAGAILQHQVDLPRELLVDNGDEVS